MSETTSVYQAYSGNTYLFGGNAPFVEELYESYLDNPQAVPEQWREFANQPAPGTQWRAQYGAEETQTAFLTDRDEVIQRLAVATCVRVGDHRDGEDQQQVTLQGRLAAGPLPARSGGAKDRAAAELTAAGQGDAGGPGLCQGRRVQRHGRDRLAT